MEYNSLLEKNVNADNCRKYLSNIFDFLEGIRLNIIAAMWYQHDGALSHRRWEVVEWSNKYFRNKWISNITVQLHNSRQIFGMHETTYLSTGD